MINDFKLRLRDIKLELLILNQKRKYDHIMTNQQIYNDRIVELEKQKREIMSFIEEHQ